jgi:TolB protein
MLRFPRRAPPFALAVLVVATGACSASQSRPARGLRGLGEGIGDRSDSYRIYAMEADGQHQHAITRGSAKDSWPALSPDGTKVAFARTRDGNTDIYVMNEDGSGVRRLTTSPAPDYHPTWSPDGTRIAFESMRNGSADIYVMNADGSDQVNLTNDPSLDGSPTWSPDGRSIVFESYRSGDSELYRMRADGSHVRRLTHSPGESTDPAWSPDGKTIAFSSSRYGFPRLFVMNPDGTGQIMVSPPPSKLGPGVQGEMWMDASPTWSPNGALLAFATTRSGTMQIWAMRPGGEPAAALTDLGSNGSPSWG